MVGRDVEELAGLVMSDDPAIALRAVAALRAELARIERVQVAAARARTASWQDIGDALGISRQAAAQKHERALRPAAGNAAPAQTLNRTLSTSPSSTT